MSEEGVPTATYSLHQQKVLALLPLISGIPSIAGSIMVLIIIVREWRQKLGRFYHRLVFMLSILNSFLTLSLMFGFLMLPEGTNWGAKGSDKTCSFQASLFSLTFSSLVYVASISAYYCMVLCFKVPEKFIARYIEPLSHFFAIVYPNLINIGALRRSYFGPLVGNRGFCWFREDPFGCSSDADIPCELGEGAEAYENSTFLIPSYILGPCVIISMITISVQVRRILLQNSETMTDYIKLKLKDTLEQCSLYVCAYLAIVIWPVLLENAIAFGITPDNKSDIRILYPIAIMAKLSLPSGGFWNVFIYIRPRVKSLRRQYPNETTWNLYRCVIWGIEPKDERQEQRQLVVRGAQTGEEGHSLFRSTEWGNGAPTVSSTPENMVGGNKAAADDDFIPEIVYFEYVANTSTEVEEQHEHSRTQSRAETAQRLPSGGRQSSSATDYISSATSE